MSITGRQASTTEQQGFLREEKALSRLEEPQLETAPALRLPIPGERSQENTGPAVTMVSAQDQWLALAGIRLQRVLCAELFREKAGVISHASPGEIVILCRESWTNLATVLAAMPQPVESYLVIRKLSDADNGSIAFLAAARGTDARDAEDLCRRAWSALWSALQSSLDYVELESINDSETLERIAAHLQANHVTELRRRREKLPAGDGVLEQRPFGLHVRTDQSSPTAADDMPECSLTHLFPWIPGTDPWHRLLHALAAEPEDAAMVVHLLGFPQAPQNCRDEARRNLAAAEHLAAREVDGHRRIATLLKVHAQHLRDEALQRLAILQGHTLAAQLFVTSDCPPAPALLAIVESSLYLAADPAMPGANEPMFHGGACLVTADGTRVVASMEAPTLDMLFGPREATAFLRTPTPADDELPGLAVNRSRTRSHNGPSGKDYPLGCNLVRGKRRAVRLDPAMRFRHTYLVGQTGTGKSTLMLHMILHDLHEGRGVGVLDPHGSLVEDVLQRMPRERIDDVILVDVADVEHPVGFNPLRLTDRQPLQYRLSRDLLIDDLYSYLDRTYDMRHVAGPMFETHFRDMLGLLMGLQPQELPCIPNLMVLRSLYTNKGLREHLRTRLAGQDIVIEEFLKEALAATGDQKLENMAPYVTSKFNRFISDLTLRNITCQNATLDFDQIVNEGKVLLFYLGKGRFGDQAAGLLASMALSRIRSAVMKRGSGPEIRPFYLYADEFQLLADERFAELLAEGRKFGLALTMAHQYVQQLPEKVLHGVFGNVGTIMALRVGAADAEMLESHFAPTFGHRDLTCLPNFRAYVRSHGGFGQLPISVEVPPPSSQVHPKRAEWIRRHSRMKYGLDREVVEAEIASTYAAYMRQGLR